jgi:hypothetical protein
MADLKISALTASTTPLAGTEVVPIVQSTTTKKVSIANLTAGRAVSAASLTATTGGITLTGGPTGYGGDEIAMATTSSSFCAISTQMTGGTFYFDHRGTGNNVNWTWRNGTGGSTTRMVLGATGDLTVNTGNVIIGTSGKGIDFSATTNSSGTMTSELFADYEEGTWTPASGIGSASSVAGTYTKQGRTVFFTGTLTFPVQVDANVATITGLPFSASASSYGAAAIRYTNQGTAFTMFQSGTSINIFLLNGGGASYTSFSNIQVAFAGFYFV